MLLDRWTTFSLIAVIILLSIVYNNAVKDSAQPIPSTSQRPVKSNKSPFGQANHESSDWAHSPDRYPVQDLKRLPASPSRKLPTIQADFPLETAQERTIREARLAAVKSNFTHAWNGYRNNAWLRDEVQPLSGTASDPFGGWAATLIDALDTIWIMGMRVEFNEAVAAVELVDFRVTTSDDINVFETTIRHLGGLLSAYDLSGNEVLLRKAKELGDVLYKAFDTPHRMPIARWQVKDAMRNRLQDLPLTAFVAEIGSLSLEFTRLSQLTGDNRYYDAIQRVTDMLEAQQMKTKLPGLWPTNIHVRERKASQHGTFTIGGKADSAYEYLIKQHVLLNGATEQYADMYNKSVAAIKRHMLYRPMTNDHADILFSGEVHSQMRTSAGKSGLEPRMEHLGCFAGGMLLLGAKLLQNPADEQVGKKLTEGCLWAYENMPGGIMPEVMRFVPCKDADSCAWNSTAWTQAKLLDEGYNDESEMAQKRLMGALPGGITRVEDARYMLRPEAIESIFIQYRITGDRTLQDRAWDMFNNIVAKTKTGIAHAALQDCTVPNPPKDDRMESFWLAETLKYFYLLFSEPQVISLDQYVLNTEAHPLRRSA